MQTLPSVCPLDCPDRCSLDVSVEHGRVRKIDGSDRYDLTAGFICAKVRDFNERVTSPLRLLHPMKRTGPKGSGAYARISWDEAIRTIADRFAALSKDPGPASILPFHYDGSNGLLTSGAMDARLWHRLGAGKLDRTFCAANAGAAWSSVFGDMPGADPIDVRHSDCVVIWGMNPSASGIHLIPPVREAVKAGAWLAVVDPWRTPLAGEADLHLPVLPGTDVLLALAMIRVAHDEGLVDRDFIAKHTRGYETLLAAAPGPEEVAALTGIPADAIRSLPRAVARAKAPFFRVGWGMERNRNGTDSIRAVLALRAVMGRFGGRGSGVALSTSKGYPINRAPAEAAHLRRRESRTINMSLIGKALTEAQDPPIRALYVYNCNPVATAPAQAKFVEALKRDSLFTVVHEQVWTDTCDWADVVLPATTFLEHAELSRSYGGHAIQYADAVIPPAGEARTNHQTFSALAKALGFDEPEFSESEEGIARKLVKDFDRLKTENILPVRRPVVFVDTFPPRGFADLAGAAVPRFLAPPVDGDLPLILISPSSGKAISSTLFEGAPAGGARVSLAAVEASRRGLRAGDRVRLRNSFGEVHALLEISDGLRPGVASLPKGLWRKATLNGWTSNALIPDHVDAQGGGACYNDARVEIDKL